jgi:hypothetical protein
MVKTPYLVQRAEIAHPLKDSNTRLSRAVDFDYMGSAEFEFGALPESFRRIELMGDRFVMRRVPSIKLGEATLRVWSGFDDEEFAEYVGKLQGLRADKIQTKENTRFGAEYPKSKFSVTDFWWDISNDAMFGFHKIFMNRVGDHVAASLLYMNEVAAEDKKLST